MSKLFGEAFRHRLFREAAKHSFPLTNPQEPALWALKEKEKCKFGLPPQKRGNNHRQQREKALASALALPRPAILSTILQEDGK